MTHDQLAAMDDDHFLTRFLMYLMVAADKQEPQAELEIMKPEYEKRFAEGIDPAKVPFASLMFKGRLGRRE